MSLIEVEHLRKEYPDITPLSDVSFRIDTGDVISVIGPSGTGKSTLLRCLNLLEEPTAGTIKVDGEVITDPACDITRVRRKVGMVFQSFNLFDNLNVIENITAAPVKLLRVPKDKALREGMELLARVGMADKAESYPDELSGGQKQRVAIARAIAMKPKILLFDEPTSALDPTMVGEVLSIIRSLARGGMTMMIVTHEMKFAQDVSTRVFYMDEGGIYEEGTPGQIFGNPLREKTRRFIYKLKGLTLRFKGNTFDFDSAIGEVEEFCRKNGLDRRMSYRMITLIEELGLVILCGHYGESTDAVMEFEYRDTSGEMRVKTTYAGGDYDPLTDGDPVSAALIAGVCQTLRYYKEENRGILECVLRDSGPR